GTYQALEKFGRDLTDAAEAGKLDPVIGRDEEIRRVVQILSRRTKNNPVLIGEPGVGKTAIAEGLAQRIVAGDVPEGLKDRRVWALDIGALLAGARSVTRHTTASASATPRSSPPPCSATATSPTASCPTRRSTWSTSRRHASAWRSTRARSSSTRRTAESCSSRSSSQPWRRRA